MDFIESFKAARRVSTPIICVRSPDPAATIGRIRQVYPNGKVPVLHWDCCRGATGINESGEAAAGILQEQGPIMAASEMLISAARLPEQSILFFANIQLFLDIETVQQALWNLRDQFKLNRRTLVLLCPDVSLPAVISQDVLVLDEPLPTEADLEKVIASVYESADLPAPDEPTRKRAADALLGLGAFPAEQSAAMSLTKAGLDMDTLWQRKYQAIEQTGGLSVDRSSESFEDIGGLEQIKKFSGGVFGGNQPPRIVVRVEEIEKTMAGARGDMSGTSQDALQVLLTEMEDRNYTGIIAVGPPGSGKSIYSKALGKTFSVPSL